MEPSLRQIRLDALSAKYLHNSAISNLEKWKTMNAVLTVIVPTLFIIANYLTKGTDLESIVNTIGFVLSVILISFSIFFLVKNIDERAIAHKIALRNNIYVAEETTNVAGDFRSKEEVTWFNRFVAEITKNDYDILSVISEKRRQGAYRQALKEIDPGNVEVVCPSCHASPWRFKKGSCQLCGNTPPIF